METEMGTEIDAEKTDTSRIEHWAGCDRTIRAFVPVKVVYCENEFPDMVKGSLAHKVQLRQSYKPSSSLDQLFSVGCTIFGRI